MADAAEAAAAAAEEALAYAASHLAKAQGHAEELTRELAISEEALLSTTRQRDALCERLQATHSELKSTEAALEASEAALEAALEAKRAALADAREQLDEKAAEAALLGYAIVALETALVATPSTDAQAAVVARERSSFAAAEAAAWEAAWETATEDERPLSTRSLEEAEPRWLTDAAHAVSHAHAASHEQTAPASRRVERPPSTPPGAVAGVESFRSPTVAIAMGQAQAAVAAARAEIAQPSPSADFHATLPTGDSFAARLLRTIPPSPLVKTIGCPAAPRYENSENIPRNTLATATAPAESEASPDRSSWISLIAPIPLARMAAAASAAQVAAAAAATWR
jgi:hypothetical protein